MDSVFFITYMAERLPELWLRTGEHLMLTGVSTAAAIIIGVPLGILVFRNKWLRNPVMGVVGILQTVPSLAMLVFLLALFQKIGVLPAIVALTLYALLPIVRNTLTGLLEVSSEVMEAAKGMGMTEQQQLRIVRIPLAAPVMLAGIRTAAVLGVGIATLSAFIGAGGLGQFINRGLALSDTKLILLGAVPAALVALIVDLSIGAFAWGLRPERKRRQKGVLKAMIRPVALMMPVLLLIFGFMAYFSGTAGSGQYGGSTEDRKKVIRIGTKNFTEQIILGEIMAQLIEAKTDLVVERKFNLGGTMICHGALVNGEIDLYAEYTGTALTAILKQPAISDPDKVFQLVSAAYGKQLGLRWLRPFGFNNTYAISVRAKDAKEKGWRRISDLQQTAPELRAGFTAEFAERPDGYPGLRRRYGFTFGDVRDLDPSLMYVAVSKGEVDVICAFATDGRIATYNLKLLADDRHFFPPYHAVPVIREKTLKGYPELYDILLRLEGSIDNEKMQSLNYEVDGKKSRPSEVVRKFLKTEGLIK